MGLQLLFLLGLKCGKEKREEESLGLSRTKEGGRPGCGQSYAQEGKVLQGLIAPRRWGGDGYPREGGHGWPRGTGSAVAMVVVAASLPYTG